MTTNFKAFAIIVIGTVCLAQLGQIALNLLKAQTPETVAEFQIDGQRCFAPSSADLRDIIQPTIASSLLNPHKSANVLYDRDSIYWVGAVGNPSDALFRKMADTILNVVKCRGPGCIAGTAKCDTGNKTLAFVSWQTRKPASILRVMDGLSLLINVAALGLLVWPASFRRVPHSPPASSK